MIKIPAKIQYVIDILQKNGFKAYIVGGCVRDSLLGKKPYDYDVTTNALPCDVQRLFEKTIPTGIKHGTVTVMLDKTPVEVTTFRTENGYNDSRHPESVNFVTEINDDLSRRDFTVNALAYNKTEGLVDCFGGENDLQNGVLKAVGNPEDRFREDALRILRLFRFACVLGFDIEENTAIAALDTAHLLENISEERIFTELYKAVSGNSLLLNPLIKSGALAFLNIKKFTVNTAPCKNQNLAFFTFLYYASCDIFDTLKKLKVSNSLRNYCCTLEKLLSLKIPSGKSEIKRLLLVCDENTFKDYLTFLQLYKNVNISTILADFNDIVATCEPYLISHLAIGGNDLNAIGISGKKTGEILKHLQGLVIENPTLNTKENLIKKVYEFIS